MVTVLKYRLLSERAHFQPRMFFFIRVFNIFVHSVPISALITLNVTTFLTFNVISAYRYVTPSTSDITNFCQWKQEKGGSGFFRNVRIFPPEYASLNSRRQPLQRELQVSPHKCVNLYSTRWTVFWRLLTQGGKYQILCQACCLLKCDAL
jgi:hypothetical protein